MKIAYILPYFTVIHGSGGGVKMQAFHWKKALEARGHDVFEITPWGDYNWKTFDVVHFFYFGFSFISLYEALKERAPQAMFICSPIIDSHFPVCAFNLLSRLKISSLKLWCEFAVLRKFSDIFDQFLVRSNHEKKYLVNGAGIPSKKILKIPLDYRLDAYDCSIKKENFCLHVSRLDDKTKNVMRLVDAAIKYKFRLVLVGTYTEAFEHYLSKKIINNTNIQLLGRVSDADLIQLYNQAKIFALPSIREGVGLVALEAAVHGCDVIITSIGGPKEYFVPNAFVVNPYSVDEIGSAVISALNGITFQPALREQIVERNNTETVIDMLERSYSSHG